MNTLKKRILIVVLIFSFLIGIVVYSFLNYLNSPTLYSMSHDRVGIIYHCNPYFLIDSRLGDSFSKEELVYNSAICKNHSFYSMVTNYAMEESEVFIDVSFVKESSSDLYTLDHHLIGKFNLFSLKEDFRHGTTHRLIYRLKDNQYELVKLEKIK